MISEKYRKIYGNWWKTVDNRIVSMIKKHITTEDSIFEVGFGSGHYLAYLNDEGYQVSGIEIREDAYKKAKSDFDVEYPNVILHQGDILKYSGNYSLVYSTGLIQCFEKVEREKYLYTMSCLANKAFYTVPVIIKKRNQDSSEQVAVCGCTEYETGNIAYELSTLYGYVETGFWKKEDICLDDDFQWFYCNNPRR